MWPFCTGTSTAASSALLMVIVGPLPPGLIVIVSLCIASVCSGGENASAYNSLFADRILHGTTISVCDCFPVLYFGNVWALVLVGVCVMKRLPLAGVSSNGSI